jgi:plastocyanin
VRNAKTSARRAAQSFTWARRLYAGDAPWCSAQGKMPAAMRLCGKSMFTSLAACAGALAARAATVDVSVADALGKPLPEAVVLFEPVSGRVPVRPMSGVQISQEKRRFHPSVTLVTVGTPVLFPNYDTVRHHVYSFSKAKTFELKLYAGVPQAPVVFDKPGIAVLGCNIHDRMTAWVVVADTPWRAQSAESGIARVEGVAAGSYRLRVWHPSLGAAEEPLSMPLAVGNGDMTQRVVLPAPAAP